MLDRKSEILGVQLVVGQAVIWSLFTIILKILYESIYPIAAAGFSMLLAALFFGAIITLKKQWRTYKNPYIWRPLLIATIIVLLFYTLVFIGTAYTSAGNASIVLLMETFFSIFLLNYLGERLNKKQLIGASLMVFGAGVILFPGRITLAKGDLLILIATIIVPFANYYTKQARRFSDSEFLLFVRTLIGGGLLTAAAFFMHQLPSYADVYHLLPCLMLNGIVVLGISKIMWLEGIHRIPIPRASAIGAIYPSFTLLFAYLILGDIPTIWQLSALIPIFLGIFMISSTKLVLN